MNLNNKHSCSVAILLFAQSDEVESALKPIAYGKRQNDLLWHKMNQKVLQTVHKTKLPYFISDENTQQGDSFGDKLSHAIQSVLDRGYDKVIVLGNDSPGLRLPHLQEAFRELQDKSVVLGSNFKGGTYLIGISRLSFNKAAFAKIDWQTPKVFGQLQALYCTQKLGIITPLADCNTKSDFEERLRDLPFYSSFKSILASFLFYTIAIYSFLKHFYAHAFIGLNFNKGSPVLE
ncbi:DUF2064 domain-containing protein [Flavobacterium frigoris]|uniref:Glycosyltransferase n=1 Tax=Flavobacterium frigoris TaxID=229204 RepID=A0A1H9QQ26_FLAFI|nr:DUF2064 domain-containing protein [Flavobacterium frigoris]SER62606.1 hypothetical protein SAMN05444355_11750 [Flavobacterium frigoris]